MSIAAENWTPTLLGDVLRFQAGFPFESRWFTSERVTGGRLVRNRDLRANDQVIYYSGPVPDGYSISNGDVLVGMDGEFEPVLWNKGPALLNQRVGRLVLSSDLHGPFIRYALIKPLAALQGATGATTVKHLSHRDVELLTIALPERREQERIADMLLDVDQLLAALDALIAKKRDIATGVRQALLSGTKRIPGFTSDWALRTIAELAYIDPDSVSPEAQFASFNYIALEDVTSGRIVKYTTLAGADAPSRARRSLQKCDVLFGTVRPNLRSHAQYRGGLQNPVASTGFAVLRAKPDVADAGFLLQHALGDVVGSQVARLIAGSNYPAVSSAQVASIEIAAPSLSEQKAIAEVLSDLDAEIDALVARREKTAMIKQGMMDELLTGRTRLV